MAAPKERRPTLTGHYVDSTTTRLCQRPERKPGVAPACEDDKVQTPGEHMKGKAVTLPKLNWMRD